MSPTSQRKPCSQSDICNIKSLILLQHTQKNVSKEKNKLLYTTNINRFHHFPCIAAAAAAHPCPTRIERPDAICPAFRIISCAGEIQLQIERGVALWRLRPKLSHAPCITTNKEYLFDKLYYTRALLSLRTCIIIMRFLLGEMGQNIYQKCHFLLRKRGQRQAEALREALLQNCYLFYRNARACFSAFPHSILK